MERKDKPKSIDSMKEDKRYNELIAGMFQRGQSNEHRACRAFTGAENIAEACALLLSDGGMRYCARHDLPSREELKALRAYGFDRHGVHIDQGDIRVENPGRMAAIGDTHAEVVLSDNAIHSILILHGATVSVRAEGVSVALVRSERGVETITAGVDDLKG